MTIQFGTDGVRGLSGKWPIDEEGAYRIGRAVAAWSERGLILIGWDTRESSAPLTSALSDGLIAGGAAVGKLGIVPTAAVSCAVASSDARGGIMVTASHNPWEDNGFKVVGPSGHKLSDPRPLTQWFASPPTAPGGRIQTIVDPLRAWREALPALRLDGQRILLDGANGAGATCAVEVLEERGAQVTRTGCSPNGRNINAGVGALHPPAKLGDCDLAIALDGDADRLALTDATHGILDGDDLLYLLTRDGDGPVVGTVMSNGGLEDALGERFIRAPVGDAHVAAAMNTHGATIGGEPSGHILFQDGMPTSDGMYTALRVLAAEAQRPLPIEGWTRLPQAKRNVRDVSCPDTLPEIVAARAGGHRVLVRPSGTEPLIRVMVEGPQAETWASRIAEALPRDV